MFKLTINLLMQIFLPYNKERVAEGRNGSAPPVLLWDSLLVRGIRVALATTVIEIIASILTLVGNGFCSILTQDTTVLANGSATTGI